MPWLIPVWMFVKDNWKLVLVGLAIASLLGYIQFLRLEANHYEKKYNEVKLEYAAFKTAAAKKEADLVALNAAITEKYNVSLKQYNKAVDENKKLLQERIKNDKELAALRVSYNAIRLFNESKRDPGSEATPQAEQGNDGEADTAQTYSLSQVWSAVAENDANHWKCYHQVIEWQEFWMDYVAAVDSVEGKVHNVSVGSVDRMAEETGRSADP